MELRGSTITGISKFSKNINVDNLYLSLCEDDIIKFIEYGEKYKGEIDRKNLKKRDKNKKKFFYNQITLHVYLKYLDIDKKINVKLFNNGSIQMTGLKSIELGESTIQYLLDKIKGLNSEHEIYITDETKEPLKLLEYYIAMINTDFDIGFKINREKLNRYLISIDIYTSFEPCIYPGVNIKYYYKTGKNNGICNCESVCNGKGKDNCCKKVTIAVFNSGKIIITGGRNMEQCKEAYKFILNILNDKLKEFEDK